MSDILTFIRTTTKKTLFRIAYHLALQLTGNESHEGAMQILKNEKGLILRCYK